ncbi:MAG: hypothetical protein HETSPECPRED_007873 [Heterodermia speciosa]|uniref:Uncharacterized protein n=1 Tax=Heterodermia speciosa TaxID=116794 RepID=A0A8H3IXT4_9LECA|nr:MAG: hypothetical protein HETSPECPRED_007873 [Heterodermia speciosa]
MPRNSNVIIRDQKVKDLDIIHLPQSWYNKDRPRNTKIVHTTSDLGRSPNNSELEGTNGGFTPLNPKSSIHITTEKPVPSSKSKAKAESTVKVVQGGKKDKTKTWGAMHDAKTVQDQVKAKAKDATQPSSSKAKITIKTTPPLKPKPKENPFVLTEAEPAYKFKSKPKHKPKAESPNPESGDEAESDDAASAEDSEHDINMKDLTNRNKTTVTKIVQALAYRQLATKGNRFEVTARFMLHELGLDAVGDDAPMQKLCIELLQSSMTRLKDILKDLGQNCVGTNKPSLVARVLKATYEDNSGDEEEGSSTEDDDESHKKASKTLATPPASPDDVNTGNKRARAVDDEQGVSTKRQKTVASDDGNESLPAEPKEDRVSTAEIGRAVRNTSTRRPKSKSKDEDNYFTFNSILDSRILFEGVHVPAHILDSALRVLTGCGGLQDASFVHDFRHRLPLYKLYREGKYKESARKCPEIFLVAQEFYEEREDDLEEAIKAAKKDDEEKKKEKEMAKKGKGHEEEPADQEMTDEEDSMEEGEIDENEAEKDADEVMSDASDEEDIDDLIMAPPRNEATATTNGEDQAKLYQKAEITTSYDEAEREKDEADDLRGKSLHPMSLASSPRSPKAPASTNTSPVSRSPPRTMS